MRQTIGLAEALDEPTLSVTIAGREYHFSELPLAQKAKLQSWIQRKVPNPMEAIKPHLDGLDPSDRIELLDRARKELKDWPPDIERTEGRMVIAQSDEGHIQLFIQALSVHHPTISPEEAERIWAAFKREGSEQASKLKEGWRKSEAARAAAKIFAISFGLPMPGDEEGLPVLKNSQAPVNGTTGASYSGEPSKS